MEFGKELLVKNEMRWRRRLRAVSLVAELDIPDREVREVLYALGRIYPHQPFEDRRWLLTEKYPAALLIGLAGVGAQKYQHGNFWPGVWDAAGFRPAQSDAALWSDAFRTNLDRFRLARFPGVARVNVDEILMHSGVPVYSLGDLLRLLIRRDQVEPGITGKELLAWARTARDHNVAVHKPVLRFLREGGDYAADFVDRCFDLLDWLALPNRPDADPTELALPRLLIDEAVTLADQGALDLRAVRASSSGRAAGSISGAAPAGGADETPIAGPAGRPQVRLDPYNNGVVLWLPPVGEAPDGRAVWTVTVDARVHTVRTQSIWPGTTETAPETVFPLNAPARSVNARLGDSPLGYELALVDSADPLLVFNADGLLVSPAESLPQGPAWLLHPEPEEFGNQDLAQTGREIVDMPAPYGWTGWRLRQVDLTGIKAIGYPEKLRAVHTSRRAYLDTPAPHRDITTVFGAPVLDGVPRLCLPVEDAPVTWSIRVRRPGTYELLDARDVTVGSDDDEPVGSADVCWVDPWEEVARPLLGAYEITVRGPLGRGLTRVLELAEGLVVHSDPLWRRMSPQGLDPAGLTVAFAPNTVTSPNARPTVTPSRVALGALDVAAQVTATAHGHSRQFLASPPHMAVRRVVPGNRSTWSYQPLRLHAENGVSGDLIVRLPAAVHADLVVKVDSQDVQRVGPLKGRQTTEARFDLARLSDTVTAHRRAVVDLDLAGVHTPVIFYRPRRLATDVVIEPVEAAAGDGERLRAVDFPGLGDVVAGCYRLNAPWRPPALVHLDSSGCGQLGDELRDVGPLLVILRIDDPWVPIEWPVWPDPDDHEGVFFLRDRAWRPMSAESAGVTVGEEELSAYLAGRGGMPRSAGGALAALRLYGVGPSLRRFGLPRDGRAAVAALLAADPTETLAAVTATGLDAAALVAPLLEAGLAALPPGNYLGDEAVALWSASPLAAILAGSADLRAASGPSGTPDPRGLDPRWRAQRKERERRTAEQLDRVAAVAGEAAVAILGGAADPGRAAGAFDVTTRQLAGMPREQLDMIWRASAVVPGALLDADARAFAARQLFDARHEAEIREVVRMVDVALRTATAALTIADVPPALDAAVSARRKVDNPRWLLLPALSIALAGLARLAAHGDERFRRVYRELQFAHVMLARHAPDLVGLDVVLAELLLTGASRPGPRPSRAGDQAAPPMLLHPTRPRELKGDR